MGVGIGRGHVLTSVSSSLPRMRGERDLSLGFKKKKQIGLVRSHISSGSGSQGGESWFRKGGLHVRSHNG